MDEVNVVGYIIKNSSIDVTGIDAQIGNRSFEDTEKKLLNLGISENRLSEIEFYSHLQSDSNADILGYERNGNKIGIEAKGVAASKKGTRDNFKYWGKGIFQQMVEIQDADGCDSVGIAIPKDCSNTLREVISSHDIDFSESKISNSTPTELYRSRKVDALETYKNDKVFLVSTRGGVEETTVKDFFGL